MAPSARELPPQAGEGERLEQRQLSLPPALRATAPLLALCATSPVLGESVSQREAFKPWRGLPRPCNVV